MNIFALVLGILNAIFAIIDVYLGTIDGFTVFSGFVSGMLICISLLAYDREDE